jgi:hypothetical protein
LHNMMLGDGISDVTLTLKGSSLPRYHLNDQGVSEINVARVVET